MRKTFIEAHQQRAGCTRHKRLFRLCGRLSLRLSFWTTRPVPLFIGSLPLMRKTFIEATGVSARPGTPWPRSLPLMRKTFIEASCPYPATRPGTVSLPLMWKTFIEVGNIPACTANSVVSSIVMEAFIEGRGSANLSPALVFCCLYSRLSFLMK